MRTRPLLSGLAVLCLLLLAAKSPAIGPGDLKKKLEKKVKEQVKAPDAPAEAQAPDAAPEGGAQADGAQGSDGGTVSTVSTKFDFVPGDKVLLMDDFARDELGEFPSRWKLILGNFDIVDFEGARWFRLNGQDGTVAIKSDGIPEKWTLEFDMHQEEMTGPAITVGGLTQGSNSFVWWSQIGTGGKSVTFSGPGNVSSTAEAPGGLNGRHHVSVMGNGTGVKVYVDRERLVNVPELTFNAGQVPTVLGFRFWKQQSSDPMITNVRFAEGGKPKVDLMATPFVTHGITFDSGSDKLKPESAPVLRQVSAYLKENPEVKVTITGHTDDVGETAANQTLSEQRAAAVAASLTADFGIDAGRMAAAGKGESTPMAANDSPEGRAMNRRVEFSKN